MLLRNRLLGLTGLLGLTALTPGRVQAAGFELTTPGARSVGRAGALVAGADDPLGLFLNPATILASQARLNTSAAVHLHLSDTCMRRIEVVEANDGTRTAGQTYPEICDSGPMAIIPELATTLRIGDKLALALGIFAPPAASAKSSYGHPTRGTFNGGDPSDPANRTPTRYLLMNQEQLQAFATLGLAYEILPTLRVGASFGWGFTKVDFTNAGYSYVPLSSGSFAASDLGNRLQGFDAFVPRVQAGLWGKPSESSPFELGTSFTWTSNVSIDDASLDIWDIDTTLIPDFGIDQPSPINAAVKHVKLEVPQVSQLSFGGRYAQKLTEPADRIGDRLSTERFDLELNAVFTFGKNMDGININLPPGSQVVVPDSEMGVIPSFNVPLPATVRIEHQWKTQYTVRLGGDYNPIPGLLGLRAGVSYETRGVSQGYQNLDFTPFSNLGLHAGTTVRIASTIDLSLAYAYYLFPDVNVSVQEAGVNRIVTGDTSPTDDAPVNAGKFTRSSNVIVAQIDAHF